MRLSNNEMHQLPFRDHYLDWWLGPSNFIHILYLGEVYIVDALALITTTDMNLKDLNDAIIVHLEGLLTNEV